MASDTTHPKERVKVGLKPGFHLTDWVRLNASMTRSSGLRRITPMELASHNTKSDCWTAYNGKVYNITNYLPYHPGGDKLMLGAGKDCTALFNKYHRWVNGHAMLSNCLIGVYAVEEDNLGKITEETPVPVAETEKIKNVTIDLHDPSTYSEVMSEALKKLEVDEDVES